MIRRTVLLASVLMLVACVAFADERDDAARRHNENALAVEKAAESDAKTYADASRYFVRRGIVADKTTKKITIRAEATGISPTEPVEFFLIGPESGKAYEAMAVSYARPSDIDAAIQFLGVPPGRAVDFNKLFFWPKGERVRMTFDWLEPPVAENPRGAAVQRSVRAENLLSDRNAPAGALAETGLVFVGSTRYTDDSGKSRYAADIGDPGSIASNYNDPTTVLDLPITARQSAVYASRTANASYRFLARQPVTVTIEPLGDPAKPRVDDLTLSGKVRDGGNGAAGDVVFDLVDSTKTSLLHDAPLTNAITKFAELCQAGREPFVTIDLPGGVSLTAARQILAALRAIQSDSGIRLEPPSKGQLFHGALFPDEKLRDREERLWQPFELKLTRDASGKVSGVFTDVRDKAVRSENESRFDPVDTDVADGAALAKIIHERREELRPLIIFADGSLTYGDVTKFVEESAGDVPTVFVYLPEP